MAAVGTVPKREAASRSLVPSYARKKNSLSFLIGPPTAPPNWLYTNFGLFCPTGRKNGLALMACTELYSKAAPCRSLVPLLVCTLIAAPPARPCSASKLLVTTFTVSMDSSDGTYATTCGSWMTVELAPSIRVLFELRLEPFTLKASAREGLVGTECAFTGGANPGSVRNNC